ncbi:hypothetical protein VTJ49DRAFT_669 [Mycothermus thermophilus]|uniref:N-acetyltransferase domain-containing protein n=1 Tax=Humicola insolens TaxID=85995 RepID=A0ABR3VEW4_HUMIN
MKPRMGLPGDVDAVTSVIINTMPLDPQWDYRFPYRKQYPEDHWKYTRMLFEYLLDPDYDDWIVMVVEDSLEQGGPVEVVAFGVWDISYINKRRYGPGYKPQDRKSLCLVDSVTEVEERGGKHRRDANHEHFNEFRRGQIRAYNKFFRPFGPEQMRLQILATLPEFQRRGHGSALCRWAMDLVRRDSLRHMSVMASPMGRELYTFLGFEWVGSFCIQVPGEEEKLVLQAMMYRPPTTSRTTLEDAEGRCALLVDIIDHLPTEYLLSKVILVDKTLYTITTYLVAHRLQTALLEHPQRHPGTARFVDIHSTLSPTLQLQAIPPTAHAIDNIPTSGTWPAMLNANISNMTVMRSYVPFRVAGGQDVSCMSLSLYFEDHDNLTTSDQPIAKVDIGLRVVQGREIRRSWDTVSLDYNASDSDQENANDVLRVIWDQITWGPERVLWIPKDRVASLENWELVWPSGQKAVGLVCQVVAVPAGPADSEPAYRLEVEEVIVSTAALFRLLDKIMGRDKIELSRLILEILKDQSVRSLILSATGVNRQWNDAATYLLKRRLQAEILNHTDTFRIRVEAYHMTPSGFAAASLWQFPAGAITASAAGSISSNELYTHITLRPSPPPRAIGPSEQTPASFFIPLLFHQPMSPFRQEEDDVKAHNLTENDKTPAPLVSQLLFRADIVEDWEDDEVTY